MISTRSRHVESLGLEDGGTVQTPTVDDAKDEKPVWLDPERISKCSLMWSDVCSSVRTEQT